MCFIGVVVCLCCRACTWRRTRRKDGEREKRKSRRDARKSFAGRPCVRRDGRKRSKEREIGGLEKGKKYFSVRGLAKSHTLPVGKPKGRRRGEKRRRPKCKQDRQVFVRA